MQKYELNITLLLAKGWLLIKETIRRSHCHRYFAGSYALPDTKERLKKERHRIQRVSMGSVSSAAHSAHEPS